MIFEFNKKKDIFENHEILSNKIKKLFESDCFLSFFSNLSKKVGIPETEISFFF